MRCLAVGRRCKIKCAARLDDPLDMPRIDRTQHINLTTVLHCSRRFYRVAGRALQCGAFRNHHLRSLIHSIHLIGTTAKLRGKCYGDDIPLGIARLIPSRTCETSRQRANCIITVQSDMRINPCVPTPINSIVCSRQHRRRLTVDRPICQIRKLDGRRIRAEINKRIRSAKCTPTGEKAERKYANCRFPPHPLDY